MQTHLCRNWHYLTPGRLVYAGRLSSKMETVNGPQDIDRKTGQFAFSL